MAFKMKAGEEGPMRKNFPNDISPKPKPKKTWQTDFSKMPVSDDAYVDLSTGEVKSKKQEAATFKKRGLWDNIHAKRKRGEAPNKPGDKGYPTEKAIKDSQ